MSDLKTWLENHPEWILRSDLIKYVSTEAKVDEIIQKNSFAYITPDGKKYDFLRDVPSFVGIRQVIKYCHN